RLTRPGLVLERLAFGADRDEALLGRLDGALLTFDQRTLGPEDRRVVDVGVLGALQVVADAAARAGVGRQRDRVRAVGAGVGQQPGTGPELLLLGLDDLVEPGDRLVQFLEFDLGTREVALAGVDLRVDLPD